MYMYIINSLYATVAAAREFSSFYGVVGRSVLPPHCIVLRIGRSVGAGIVTTTRSEGMLAFKKTRVQNLYELRLLFRLFNPLTSNGSDGLRAQLDLMLQTNGCN